MTRIDGRSGFVAGQASRTWLAVVTALMLAFSLTAMAAPAGAGDGDPGEKVTICHASGLEGTTKYETLSISENAVYGRHGNAGHFNENGTTRAGHEHDTFGECPPQPPTQTPDYCDVSQRPGGMSVAEWLRSGKFNPADCFAITQTLACGSLNLVVTEQPTGFEAEFEFVYVMGAGEDTSLEWQDFPADFDEDEGGGEVSLTAYIVGPEKDYLVGTELPNYWDNNGRTITIDTDCEEPEDDTTLKVIKDVTGANGGVTEFDFEISSGDLVIDFTLEDGESQTFKPVDPWSTVTIVETEKLSSKWTTSISCESDLTRRGAFREDGVSIEILNIQAGEDIVCTVINTFDRDDDDDNDSSRRRRTTTTTQLVTPCFDGTAENETGECVKPAPPEDEVTVLGVQIEATTTTIDAVATDTLPFTGDESNGLVMMALLTLIVGAIVLAGTFLEPAATGAGRHQTNRAPRWNNWN